MNHHPSLRAAAGLACLGQAATLAAVATVTISMAVVPWVVPLIVYLACAIANLAILGLFEQLTRLDQATTIDRQTRSPHPKNRSR